MRIQGRKAMPRRRFTVLDALILVVAAVVGFAGFRGLIRFRPLFEGVTTTRDWASEAHGYARFVLMLATYLILALRLMPPRPRPRRLACQPGFAACFAMIVLGMGRYASNQITTNTTGFSMQIRQRLTFEHQIYYFSTRGFPTSAATPWPSSGRSSRRWADGDPSRVESTGPGVPSGGAGSRGG